MQEFDLKQFLVEHKMTKNSRLINEENEEPTDDFLGAPAEPAPAPAEPSGQIDLDTAKELIFNTKGKIFTVVFIKKDGSERTMNARLGVKKYLKGGELKYNAAEMGLIPVYDIQAKGYRMINTKTIQALNIGGKKYTVLGAIAESREEDEMMCESIYG
jgi:hypothetical protein